MEIRKTDSFRVTNLFCMYLAQHELESVIIVIITIIIATAQSLRFKAGQRSRM